MKIHQKLNIWMRRNKFPDFFPNFSLNKTFPSNLIYGTESTSVVAVRRNFRVEYDLLRTPGLMRFIKSLSQMS